MRTSDSLVVPALGRLYGALTPLTEPLIRLVAGLSLAAHGYPKLFGATAANAAFFEQAAFIPRCSGQFSPAASSFSAVCAWHLGCLRVSCRYRS